MHRPSHEDVCWLEVAMNAASAVDEAQPLQNAVQDVAHAALCEKGILQELARVDLVHLTHGNTQHLSLSEFYMLHTVTPNFHFVGQG